MKIKIEAVSVEVAKLAMSPGQILDVSGGVESGLRSTAVIPSAGANCYVL